MIRITLLIFSFTLFSCSRSAPLKEGVLPEQKMQLVLWDIMRADEKAEFRKLRDSSGSAATLHTSLYDTVFAIHKIDRQTFDSSLKYYQSRPDLLKVILDSLQRKADAPITIPVAQ